MYTPNKTLVPHKHAAQIKAWADGAEIQCKLSCDERWFSCPAPQWASTTEYRIKPQTIRYRNYLQQLSGILIIRVYSTRDDTDPESWGTFIKWLGDWQEVEV